MSNEFAKTSDPLEKRRSVLLEFLRNNPIGTDIDNSEVWTNECGLQIINQIHKTNFTVEDLEYDFAIVDLIKKHCADVLDPLKHALAIWNSSDVQTQAVPFGGSWHLAMYLHEQNIPDFFRITSRPSSCKDNTHQWYKKNMPWIDLNRICIQQDGNQINPEFKIENIRKNGIKLFFEDSPNHAEKIVHETDSRVMIVSQRTNASYIFRDDRIITVPQDFIPELPTWFRMFLWLDINPDLVAHC